MNDYVKLDWRRACALAALIVASAARPADARSRTVWDSPRALVEWVAETPRGAVEQRAEGKRRFIRIRAPLPPKLRSPGCPDTEWTPACPRLFDPRLHNAVRIIVRHNMGWDRLGGYWLHRNTDTARGDRVPAFDGTSAPGDNAWHEVVLKLTDSPFLELTQEVISVTLRPFAPRRSLFVTSPEPLTGDQYLDIARIELVRVDEPTPRPTVSGVRPGKSVPGREVVIEGAGFAQPAERNVVLFGDGEYWIEADVIAGDARSLRVRVPRRRRGRPRPSGGQIATPDRTTSHRQPA